MSLIISVLTSSMKHNFSFRKPICIGDLEVIDIDGDVMNEDIDMMESTLNNGINDSFAVNRSGLIRTTVSTNEIETETDVSYNLRDGVRNFKESIKIILASSCAKANISPHLARVSFKTHSVLWRRLSFVTQFRSTS